MTFKPLVIGPPRSGFTLLISVLINLLPYSKNYKKTPKQIGAFLLHKFFEFTTAEIIEEEFRKHNIKENLIYNNNFRYILGGPIWLDKKEKNLACFRKYIGVVGMGDFTINIRHPKFILDSYQVVHSHYDPEYWMADNHFRNYNFFSSIRNPIDIINSSCFSINAISSTYIQRFIPKKNDNDNLRKELALYKFTDLVFFEGLVKFLSSYLDNYLKYNSNFKVMRWESLIGDPYNTIKKISDDAEIEVDKKIINGIWEKLDHRNLSQDHKHNFRAGHGLLNGWMNELTNVHLEIMEKYNFNFFLNKLGYEPIKYLNEKKYSNFQKKVSSIIKEKKVYQLKDKNLLIFNWNKSNIDSSKFKFDRYAWKKYTQIERSSFKNKDLLNSIWDKTEDNIKKLNTLFTEFDQINDKSGLFQTWLKMRKIIKTNKRYYQIPIPNNSYSEINKNFIIEPTKILLNKLKN